MKGLQEVHYDRLLDCHDPRNTIEQWCKTCLYAHGPIGRFDEYILGVGLFYLPRNVWIVMVVVVVRRGLNWPIPNEMTVVHWLIVQKKLRKNTYSCASPSDGNDRGSFSCSHCRQSNLCHPPTEFQWSQRTNQSNIIFYRTWVESRMNVDSLNQVIRAMGAWRTGSND